MEDHLYSGFHLTGEIATDANAVGEKMLHDANLPDNRVGFREAILNTIHQSSREEIVKRSRAVKENVRTIMQNGRRPNLSEADDDQRRTYTVLDHADMPLQT